MTRFSIRNVAAIVIFVLLVSMGGVYTATQLKMEAMPDVNFPVIVTITPYPGASPEDIDKKVTQPIEKALQGIKGAEKVTSISADSTSVVIAQFDFDVDLDKVQQAVRDSISRLKLPDQALDPIFNRFGFNTFPFMTLSLTSDKKSPAELKRWVNDGVKGALESVDGVGEIQVKGEGEKAVYIRLKPEQLKKYNLSVQQVQQALQMGNMSLPVGDLHTQQINLPVRVEQSITSIEELQHYPLTVFPHPVTGIAEPFKQLGQAVGGLSQGLGQVGQGVGLLQGQVQLLQQAQLLQAHIIGEQIALNNVRKRLQANPDDLTLKGQAALLTAKIAARQTGLKQIHVQLKKLQAQLPQTDSSKRPSGAAQLATGMSEPKIKTIQLSDIATITESAEGNTMITRTDGKPSVNIDLIKDPDANIVDVAEQVKQKISELQKNHPDVNVTLLFDQSRSVKASIHSIVREGLLGAMFAAVVILIFLRNIRTTLISIVSIPVSVLATLILLKQADLTLNIMTLGGLAVAIGRVVDDSIVVIENIYRHMRKGTKRDENLIIRATREVASAITSSTLTTVAVFVPLGLVDGIVGKVFLPFAITVTIALLCSLVVAVTIVPVLAKLMLLRGKKIHMNQTKSRTAAVYRKALAWSLDHKGMVLTVSTLFLLGSLLIIPLVGTSFIPSEKDKAVQINLKMPSGTDLNKTNEITRKIEQTINKHKEVNIISASVGNLPGHLSKDGTIGSPNRASIFVSLASSANIDKAISYIRTEMKPFQQAGEIMVNEVKMAGTPSSMIQVVIRGNNIDKIKKAAAQLTARMKNVAGLTNVRNNLSAQQEIITIHVHHAKAAKKGLSSFQVAGTVRGLLEADQVLELQQGKQTQEVRLGLEKGNVHTTRQLRNILLLSAGGKMVKLGDIATVSREKGPVTIQKENGQLYATVSGNVTVKDTGAVSRNIQQMIREMTFPKGISVSVGGDAEEINKSFAQLGLAMIVAVAAVYIVMIIAFGEATAPFTILFSLPYAVIGGLVGLLIAGQPISVSSLIGALMLIGIVVTNAIVLIDRVQQQRKKGLGVREALLEAAGTRLRPILMTALATICALLPLGLGYGEGTLISQSLAVVVVGGLTSSTLLTLFIVPIVYLMLTRVQERLIDKKDEQMVG